MASTQIQRTAILEVVSFIYSLQIEKIVMRKIFLIVALLCPLLLFSQRTKGPKSSPPSLEEFYSLSFKTLSGDSLSFQEYKGKKVLIVNSSPQCEYAWQLNALQELQFAFSDKLVVVAFHSSQFSGDSGASNRELLTQYSEHFFISSNIVEDSQVKGADRNALYNWLYNSTLNGKKRVEPIWNFWKFIVDENGVVVGYFTHLVSPLDKSILDLVK